ncbi:MAG TPA: hypothetical protein VFP68_10335, partial [Burkholderiaceae bacterium]|nr:hypothetical protein [Burkholderiaceae bacterium]
MGDGRDRRSTDPGATGDLSRRRKSNSGAVQAALGSETIAQIRPPSWFSRLRKGFRDGRKTEATQVGTRPQAVGTQEPEDAERLVAMPRFEGAGETNIEGTQLGVAGEVMQAKIRVFGITDESQLSEEEKALHDKLDKAKVRFSLPKEAGAGPAARTSTWVKDASEAMGQGVLAIAKEALGWRKASTLPDAVKWYREGQKDKPADSKKLSQEASLVLDQLTTTAVIERAEWALDIAPMLKNAEGTDSEIQDLLKTTLKEVKSKAIELSGKEAKLAKDKALDSLSGMMPVALRHQVQHDLAELSHRLDLASPNKSVPDVLGAKVLTEEVKRLFKGNLKEAARALHDLREVQPKDFCTLSRDLMKQPDARVLTRDGLIKNPMLRLVAALSRRTCGASMITAIVRPDGKSTEPLRVALRSVAAYQEEMQKNPAHPKISEAQRDWLCSGLEFACYTLSPSEEGRDRMKDEGPELTRHRRIAYRALQNGFTTNEPGSAYARVNAFLDFARGSELQETGRRNARAAAGFLGRTRNAITGGIGEATQWRKSALKQLSKAAAATGLFPTRDGAVDALNQTAVDVREALSERRYNAGQPGNVPLEPAEKLLLGVLEAANLGAWPLQHIDPKRLKRLTADFFDKAEAQLGPEGLESLGKGLREEWTGLRTSHPNIGHLFCRLFRNVDLRKIVHRGSKDAPPRNLQERGKRLDMHADRAIESFANLAHACVTATGGGDAAGQAAALAALACKTAAELKKVSPKAALGALRVDVFEKVENGLAQHQFHILPKEGRPSFQEVRRMVRDSWPPSVRADWDEMKASGVDVSRLLRHLTDALSRLLGDLPTGNTRPAKIVGADGVPESLPERVTDCVEDAEGALKALQRDIHVNRFELALCDTITMFNDVRCPMDAAAVLRSL